MVSVFTSGYVNTETILHFFIEILYHATLRISLERFQAQIAKKENFRP